MTAETGPGDERLFAPLTAGTPVPRRLHTRLAREAEQEQLLDVAYQVLDTSVGSLLVAATPRGLIRVAFAVQDHELALQQLAERVSPRILHTPGRLADAMRQIEEYLAGRRTRFQLPLDWRLSSGYRREVLHHLPDIGYGRTESYAQVAAATGRPRAVRAAGTACATNPLPLVVPCHRVIRSDGGVGGYAGGSAAKHTLLALESGHDPGAPAAAGR